MNYIKADLYRIVKEKLALVSLVLLLVFAMLFAYVYRKDVSDSAMVNAISVWSSLMPLFLVTPAKIFFGEDFANRTVNNFLIKSQDRLKVFSYKWVAHLGMSILFVLLAYVLTSFLFLIWSGHAHLGVAMKYFLYQLPIYLVISSLIGLIFNFFKRSYQSYTVYLLLALLFDDLFTLLMALTFKTSVFMPYLMFNQLGQVDPTGVYLTKTVICALFVSLIYAVLGFGLFYKREFK